jgi:hypothetical protein
VIVFSLSTLVIMYKLGSVILSFSITARYMKPNERDSIRRCRLLYRLLYLRKDRRSSDGWIVVTSGSGDRRKKLFLFRP